MAKLSREDVLKLAELSRLRLSDDEIESFQAEITEILGYVEQLQSVKLDNYLPTSQVTGLHSVTREDEIIDYGPMPQDLLKNVPQIRGNLIKVKRMLT